jgi:hypothetical protein
VLEGSFASTLLSNSSVLSSPKPLGKGVSTFASGVDSIEDDEEADSPGAGTVVVWDIAFNNLGR